MPARNENAPPIDKRPDRNRGDCRSAGRRPGYLARLDASAYQGLAGPREL